MAEGVPNTPETLCREVMNEASQQRGDIFARARSEVEAISRQAEREVEQLKQRVEETLQAEVERRRAAAMANVIVETGRRRAIRVESLLESIRNGAAHQLHTRGGFNFREVVLDLASEALGQMAGDAFRLRVSHSTGLALGDGIERAVRTRLNRSSLTVEMREDSVLEDDAVVLEDAEGRQSWQVDPSARLERLWPELRVWLFSRLGGVESTSQRNTEP